MRYSNNARWLLWFTPFRTLSISAAYLTPFFIEHGLSTSQIFLLQSIFSAAYILWELPSGLFADKFGRAFSMKLSAPIAGLAMIAYGMSGEFWQFVVCELALAIANGLISGVDTALLMDSLKADKREHEFVKISQRIDSLGYVSIALAVPLALGLVHLFGVSAAVTADGVMVLLGLVFVMRLREAPTYASTEQQRPSAWPALLDLARDRDVRWLVTLRSALNTATYLGFWLAALYYEQLGIPVLFFGAILAGRNLWKAWLSHRFHHTSNLLRLMRAYAALAGIVYLAMASRQLWLVWMVLGHDMVQALANWPLAKRLNDRMLPEHRATMNSMANLVQRLVYTIAGPLVGLIIDKASLQTGMVVVGVTCSSVAFLAIWRLSTTKALD